MIVFIIEIENEDIMQYWENIAPVAPAIFGIRNKI